MDFYALPPDEADPLQQGDLLAHIPFSYFSLTNARARAAASGPTRTRDLTKGAADPIAVMTRVEFYWGIVLNQSCDLQPNPKTGNFENPVTIARVLPIRELHPKADFSTPAKALKTVRTFDTEAKAPTTFYLPAAEGTGVEFPRSGADLLDVQRFAPEDTVAMRGLVRLRFTPDALHAFQARCSYCFGRYAVPDGFYLSAEERAEKQRQDDEARRSRGG